GFSQNEDAYVYGDNATNNPKTNNNLKKGFDWSKTTIGGGFALQFGNVTIVSVAPNLGYYLTESFIAGVGINYTYENNKAFTPEYKSSTYGANIYTQYLIPKMPLMAHLELESANIAIKYQSNLYSDITINLINVYVGGGLKQLLGGNSYLYILGLWNLNETKESSFVQPNPIIRGGIAIGL
ncbi:MAG: hypothetical protein ACPGSL_10175, partial [Vicingaceae bacterium]